MSEYVSAEFLLEGAVYALEQCGLLLRDANLLYQNGSYASAVVLAAFAREELGRWAILIAIRLDVLGGARVTVENVQIQCADHLSRQKAGMLSLTISADRDSAYGRLLQTTMTASVGSTEWKAARAEIEKVDRQMKKRVPHKRHSERMNALYVDAVSSDRWNRPYKTVTPADAFTFLQAAANDYVVQFERYTNLQMLEHIDPQLCQALQQWSNRPELPGLQRMITPP
jgi:AbiV family abortive infection protein